MDLMQSKLNVIEWLTDYRGNYTDKGHHKIVELRHKTGWLNIVYTAKTIRSLLKKLDNFISSKVIV